jgi:DNA-binding Lrp family transcriptional regulator
MRAYVLIQTDGHEERLAGKLRAIPGVLSAEDLTGPFDGIALASSDSLQGLVEHVIAPIQDLPGVTRALPAPLIGPTMDASASDSWSAPDEAA